MRADKVSLAWRSAYGHLGYTDGFVWEEPQYNEASIILSNRMFPNNKQLALFSRKNS